MAKLFGFSITRNKDEVPDLPSIVPPIQDDGAVVVASGGVYGQYVDLDGTVRSEGELINKYREMSEHPEVEAAIDDITNEAIVLDENKEIVDILLEKINLPDKIKDIIMEEFDNVKLLYEFNNQSYELFKRWYVDGRMYFQVMIDPENIEAGIQEIRYIDPRKIRKIKEIKVSRDAKTDAPLIEVIQEYYLFNDKGFSTQGASISTSAQPGLSVGVKIAKDSVIHVTSGIASAKGDIILSYLHKAIKPLNQLRSLEDSLVIYRISRAPERRIFYIDVGNLPKMKAEQYLREVMVRFKNKIVYDAGTGEIRDDRKFMTMLEDFWLPRREGGRGTEITTLPGGQNLGQIEDIIFFQRKLFRSLSVPITRLDPEAMFNYGRANEITRDEVKFSKFIDRLRVKFASLFTKTLRTQLILKNIMKPEEFDAISHQIKYKFASDTYFEESKTAEVTQDRMEVLQQVVPFIGRFYSNRWVRKNLLGQTDIQMAEEDAEIAMEANNPQYATPLDAEGQAMGDFMPHPMGGNLTQIPPEQGIEMQKQALINKGNLAVAKAKPKPKPAVKTKK